MPKPRTPNGEVNATADLPLTELMDLAEKWIQNGFDVYFKFTCGQCGTRLTFEEPNKLYQFGKCGVCGHTTTLKFAGFMPVWRDTQRPMTQRMLILSRQNQT